MNAEVVAEPALGGRARLMLAARELFPLEGYCGASVAKILAHCQLQAPSLYHHFQDKEGLFMAWTRVVLSELSEDLRSAIQSSGGLEATLESAAEVLMRASSPDIILLRRDARDLLNPKNSQELHTNLLESVYEPIMNAMLSSGSLPAQSIDRLVDAFVIGATGLSRTYAMNSHTPRETAHWWAKHFLHGATAA